MYEDEIIREVWRIRDAYVAEHHYSFDEIFADLQARQKKLGDRLVDSGERSRDSGSASRLRISTQGDLKAL